jgi:[FeFe] hydrogenase H-cluster maturation GTPase HydF
MGLNSTPSSERINIAFFGKTNSGKSSLINAVTNQSIAITSDIAGTTTDPVYKAMEILPLGPVNLIDTAGFDDESALGKLRIEKTNAVLTKTDIAVLVTDSSKPLDEKEKQFLQILNDKNIKYIIAFNKADLIEIPKNKEYNEIYVSALKNINIDELKELMASFNNIRQEKKLISDKITAKDKVILVTPIDSAAPKGRIILPQQQVLRDLLDAGAVTVVVKETELKETLNIINSPKLVITDSQVFKKVNAETPENVLLTSFSIIFARYKGVLETAVKGVKALETLKDDDIVLISEGCTHHRQCDDIGTVKLPKWIKNYTGNNINFEYTSGTAFPNDLSKYKMIIHCGGCMLKEQEVLFRYNQAIKQNIPISNYGITIAYINGILKRSVQIFPDIYNLL